MRYAWFYVVGYQLLFSRSFYFGIHHVLFSFGFQTNGFILCSCSVRLPFRKMFLREKWVRMGKAGQSEDTDTLFQRIALFVKLGVTVVTTFGLLFAPWLNSVESIRQVFIRIFPVARGLYEDKVANVWCALNVVIKLRQLLSVEATVRLRYRFYQENT